MRFYYSFLAYRFSPISTTLNLWPWVASTLPFSMGRPLTLRGRKPTSSSSSSSTGEFRNLLYPSYIKLDFVSSVTSSFGVKGGVSAVVDRMLWPFWTSTWQVTRGWSQIECKARWPSRHASDELDSSELGPIQWKGCPGAIFHGRYRSTKSDISAICSICL